MAALALVAGGVPLGAAESGEEAPRTRATGNWFGMRTTAFEAGIDLQGGYVIDLQANPPGGREQDSAYAGLLQLDATVDMGRLLGAHGMTFYVAGTWGSGTDLSASVGNVFQVGQAFVARTVKLSQLFVAQSLAGGAVLLKGGRVSVAIDFAFLPIDQYLVNSALNGNPLSIPFNDAGFVQDPVVQWGGQATLRPSSRLAIKLGVYDAQPVVGVGQPSEDVSFHTGEGAFLIGELGFETHLGKKGRERRGQIKLGAYYDTSHFALLDDPARSRTGQYGFYLLAQHEIFREGAARSADLAPTTRGRVRSARAEDPVGAREGLSTWLAVAASPLQDISRMPFYASGGLGYRGLLPGRSTDMATLSLSYGRFSRDSPERSWETVLEINYRVNLTPWLYLTPDFQYVFNPGGEDLPDAVVLGVETAVTF
jgi:porin